jgi:hypothetical protein
MDESFGKVFPSRGVECLKHRVENGSSSEHVSRCNRSITLEATMAPEGARAGIATCPTRRIYRSKLTVLSTRLKVDDHLDRSRSGCTPLHQRQQAGTQPRVGDVL